jgi:hypothetical protein
MADGEYVEGSYWFYAPNQGASIFFLLAFLLSTTLHLWQSFRYKSFDITSLFVISGLVFVIGYGFRVVGAFGSHDNLPIFILSLALISIGPYESFFPDPSPVTKRLGMYH